MQCALDSKGKVERPIRYVRESFFYGRTFLNDADLNAQAERWLERTANQRRHRTIEEAPQLRFERDERDFLRRLAGTPYPRLHGGALNPATPKPAYKVEVQRRPLSVYAEAVR